MIPDKLYINKYMIRPGMLHPAEFPPDNPEWEYIRKDALIELIKEESKFCDDGEMIFRGLIDKLNSM